jgi:hypothetical protein
MRILHLLRLRFRSLFRREPVERELDLEMRYHLEELTRQNVERGLAPEEARAAAFRQFGGFAQIQEDCRDQRRTRWLEDLAADLRYAFRAFVRSPGFTLTAVVSLALGIGANSAIFTALETVIWRELPVADPASLVKLSVLRRESGETVDLPAAFARQMQKSGLFSDVITATPDGLSFSCDARAERIIGEAVSPNFFAALGVHPILGQTFTPAVQHGGWAAEAVISYSFWKHRFGGDPAIIGRTIRLNTYPFTIVGVSPPSFFGITRGTNNEVRIPVLPEGREVREISLISGSPDWPITTVARLRPGATMAQPRPPPLPSFNSSFV